MPRIESQSNSAGRPDLLAGLITQVPADVFRRAGRLPRVILDYCNPREVRAAFQGPPKCVAAAELGPNVIWFGCTCREFATTLDVCEHAWATIVAGMYQGFLSRVSRNVDLTLIPLDLPTVTADTRSPPTPAIPEWEHKLGKALSSSPAITELPKAAESPLSLRFEVNLDEMKSAEALALKIVLREVGQHGATTKDRRMPTRAAARRRLSREDAAAFVLACGIADRMYGGYGYVYADSTPPALTVVPDVLPLVLPELCRQGRVVLPLDGAQAPAALAWDDAGPWSLAFRVAPAGADAVTIVPELHRGEARIAWSDLVYLSTGGFLLTRAVIAAVDAKGGAPILRYLMDQGSTFTVPRASLPRLLELLLGFPNLPPLDVAPELETPREMVRPTPEVHLTNRSSPWGRETILTFDYAGQRAQLRDRMSGWITPRGTVVTRDAAFERDVAQRLVLMGFRPDMASTAGFGIAAKRLPGALRELVATGWRVLSDGRLIRQPGAVRLTVTSGVDWFDLEGGAEFDGEVVALPRLLAAARKGEKTIVLADGSIGALPAEWLRKYAGLAALGKADGSRVRFTQGQAGVLDAMLAAQPDVKVDEIFARARERLKTFERIEPMAEAENFRGELRPYQREGLGWLAFLENLGFGGCLADDMGLGKTIEVLAYLVGRKRTGPSLVVCPRSLVFNWRSEAAKFAPTLRVLDHSGGDRTAAGSHFADYDVVLVTYGILRRDAAALAKIPFDVVILDEAQAIKNRDTESAKAARLLSARQRLALSGTPVENRVAELGSLFDFLNPGLLGSTAAFDGLASGRDPDALAGLARALRPFILRRTKEQVVKDLPKKLEQTITCELDAAERRLYDELRDHYRGALLGKIEEKGLAKVKIQVLEALLRLRQAACHPGLVDPTRVAESSAKVELLLDRIDEVVSEGHKALVFSQFTSLLAIVKTALDARGIVYEYLDGATRDRESRVARFRTDPACPLFLISLKAGGVGLNLVEADYVFLLDPWWNPAVEAQAIDRTHRIGQTRSVFAYRLIARDTVEEKVLELQGRKRALADAIIQADETLIRSLTRDDLLHLLS